MNDELKKIWNSFITNVANNKNLKDLYVKLDSGVATYQEAQEFTSSLSNYLVSWLAKEYPSDSQKVLDALKDTNICKNFFAKADEYTYSVQKTINESLGIGLNASKPALKTTLIDKDTIATGNYDYDLNKYANAVELSANKRVDTIQQENARFQSDAGFGVTVSRTYDRVGLSDGRTCKWCLERVGSNVPYKQAVSRGMFQRHEGCHCMIEYNNNGTKTRQYSKGGRDNWIDQMGQKQKFEVAIDKENTKIFQTYESKYSGIYTQTYSTNAQKMATFLNKNVKLSSKYGDLNEIVIVKNSSLGKIAGYEQETNRLYVSEELANPKKFNLLVDKKFFPAENLPDVIEHELGGHKAHWDSIKRYAENNNLELYGAKQKIEEKLRKYVKQQFSQDGTYIQKTVSRNAYESFVERDFLDKERDELLRKNNLNELVADARVLIGKGKLTDSNLEEFVKEVVNYDGSPN